jgi:hypothetical protein
MNPLLILLLLGLGVPPAGAGGDSLETLPVCGSASLAPVAGWQRVTDDSVTLTLPSSFRSVESKFIHGGRAWGEDDRHAQVAWGMWGLSSFSADTSAPTCRFDCHGVQAVRFDYQQSGYHSVVVWIRSGQPFQPAVSAGSSRAGDGPVINAIVLSACQR